MCNADHVNTNNNPCRLVGVLDLLLVDLLLVVALVALADLVDLLLVVPLVDLLLVALVESHLLALNVDHQALLEALVGMG